MKNNEVNPLVSVVIPTYNREIFLMNCLNSIANQLYRPIEVIIVDDGSTDNSTSFINSFVEEWKKDDFLIKYLFQKNSGAPAARNNGFRNSKGDYIQFLDSDDMLDPKKIKTEIEYLQKNNLDLVYSKAQRIDENGDKIDKFINTKLTNTSIDYFQGAWQTMAALYKRKTIENNGLWNEDLHINQDWEYAERIIINKFSIGYIDIPLSYYRQHGDTNIGTRLTTKKIRSKEESTSVIYDLLYEKEQLDEILNKKFFKRYLFCVIQYGILKEYNYKNNLLKKMQIKFESTILLRLFLAIDNSILYKVVMYLYNLQINKKF